jgi:hypothetical protein
MSYSAEISRDNPTCLLFVIDQSGSMSDKMATVDSGARCNGSMRSGFARLCQVL